MSKCKVIAIANQKRWSRKNNYNSKFRKWTCKKWKESIADRFRSTRRFDNIIGVQKSRQHGDNNKKYYGESNTGKAYKQE